MGKGRAWVLGGETFATKKSVIERCRAIVAAYTDEQTVADPAHDAFVRDLLDRHPEAPEKIGDGVARVVVWTVPPYYSNRGFRLVRVDGSEVDFSFLACVNGPRSAWSEYCAAARAAVRDQTLGFKHAAFDDAEFRGATLCCALTGATLERRTSHVDHAAPATFDRIVRAFVAGHDWATAAVVAGTEGTARAFADPAYAARFAAYHATHATLRLLSASANLGPARRTSGA